MPTQADRSLENVLFTQDAGVATITLNRPERANALTMGMMVRLHEIVDVVARDDAIRVLVLRGAGRGFCGGDDLKGMGEAPQQWREARGVPVAQHQLMLKLRALPKPVVAAIHGFALGIGLDIAMACDIRVCTADALIADPRCLERGMHAASGVTWFMPRAIGVTRTMEFILLGRRYTGAEAAAAGIVTRAVEPDRFEPEVADVIRILANGPTKTFGVLKAQVYDQLNMDLPTAFQNSSYYRLTTPIDDRAEGIRAFVEKRPPNFTGH
jgi:2-(1,2-epoxy-1,2-dihydrophenyl)acetyl-CoA isomerase